ncbi:MAG: nitrate reductase molybdenum cofactor assembly chaperone [Conexivisphaerales archaeon]
MDQSKKRILYICSRLLLYPNSSLLSSLNELKVQGIGLPEQVSRPLMDFIDYLIVSDPIDLQESYVRTFDFSKDYSLYLTYASFGTRMERGSELITLKYLYTKSGIIFNEKELPDYLPTFLKFLSVARDEDANLALKRYSKQIAELAMNLEKARSPYSKVLKVIEETIRGEI